jgi:hypothetical protein
MDACCPKCKAEIGDTYEGADPSVGMMTGGYYCHVCDHSVADWEVDREPMDGDAQISFARESGERLGTPLSELSNKPGAPGYDEFKRIARTWGHG